MTFSWEFNLGHVIMIVVPMIGVMVGYVTLRVKSADNEERTKSLNTRVDAYGTALADLRLHVETTCVKKDDLDRVEDRLTTKMDKVEHGIRGALTTAISEMARAMRPPRKGEE